MTTLHYQVRSFMEKAKQELNDRPTVPSDHSVRLHGRLVIEEAFELLQAMFRDNPGAIQACKNTAMNLVDSLPLQVNLVEVADACADIDYVVEGTRCAFGIEGKYIADEVHRSNMLKFDGPVLNGKQMKPKDWTPPDVKKCLQEQGWKTDG